MRAFRIGAWVFACSATALYGQMGRTSDWWTYAGDAQRTGWEKNDQKFTRDDVKNFQQLWSMKLPTPGKGPRRLAAPVILGNLIGSRGFKELAFVQNANGDMWAIDSDLARPYWDKHFPGAGKTGCSAIATMPGLPAPVVFRFNATPRPATAPATPPAVPTAPSGAPAGQGIPGGGPGAPAAGPPAGAPANPPTTNPPTATAGPAAPRGEPRPAPPFNMSVFAVRPVYMVSPDGKLRQLNQDDGAELHPAFDFLPEGVGAASFNLTANTVYAVGGGCGKPADSVYAIDFTAPANKAVEFKSGVPLHTAGGTTLSASGTVYVQTGDGKTDAAGGSYGNAVVALSANDLKVKDYVTLPAGGAAHETSMNITTPVAFSIKGRELLVTAGKDGRLYVLDANALGGSDHKTPLARTEPLTKPEGKDAGRGIWGHLTSWEGPNATRFVLATVWGPLTKGLPAAAGGGKAGSGSVVAFKVEEENGAPKLTPVWTSRNLESPDPPVVAQGIVFVLENGKYKRKMQGKIGAVEESAAASAHATLYALDGMTGQELWSSGDKVKAAGSLTGLSIANSRVYFTTVDNTLQVFGKYLETEQH